MAKKHYKEKTKLSYAVKLIVVGLLLGTVFTLFELDKVVPVKREDCSLVQTCFVNYELISPKGTLEAVQLQCADWGQYYIDNSAFTEQLQNELDMLSPHEEITMLVQRNTAIVMELSAQGNVLLSFEEVAEAMEAEFPVMFYVGLLMYAFTLLGIYRLVKQLRS